MHLSESRQDIIKSLCMPLPCIERGWDIPETPILYSPLVGRSRMVVMEPFPIMSAWHTCELSLAMTQHRSLHTWIGESFCWDVQVTHRSNITYSLDFLLALADSRKAFRSWATDTLVSSMPASTGGSTAWALSRLEAGSLALKAWS